MPLFISDEELSRLSTDGATVAERADAYIREVYVELETVRAKADAASITAEQTFSLHEQKYLSLSKEFTDLQSQNAQLKSSFDERLAELAQAQAQKHQLHLQSIEKDGEIERLSTEVSELHKSKRQLLEMIEQKDLEISEKNATLKSYLDKIVNLTENAAQKEGRLCETQAELVRAQATCTRISQEKELIERHNTWLKDDLTNKDKSLIELSRKYADLEADMFSKIADVQRRYDECSASLNRHKERVRELENKLSSLQEELCSSKQAAATNEKHFSDELSTANKLVELYKERSEEWSRKATDLEGVIKALQTHLSLVENDYKERLEKEESARKQFEEEAADLKAKIEKCEAEIESTRKANELNLLPLSNFRLEPWMPVDGNDDMVEGNQMLVPKIPAGVSGTALAASLLRDGWSLAKMYAKYQEAVDALRHEQLGRKESESILQRVLCELEEKAGVIMDERAEYERMVEAYSMMNQKLHNSTSERTNLEKTILELKADLRRHERDNSLAQKEITDLQKQVTVLLKECRDIQLRGGSTGLDSVDDYTNMSAAEMSAGSDAERVISERLLTYKDINGLVEQNVQLRSLVRNLSDQIENKEMEFKEKLEMELKKHTGEAASKVAAVVERAEEQGRMIESLHASVAMYRRLYEEEHKLHSSYFPSTATAPDTGRKDLLVLLEGSQEASKKAQEKAAERVRCLEEDLAKNRSEIILLRAERDKLALEANFAREKLESVMKEAEHQRDENNGVLARNVEFSHLIVDYQKKLRDSAESLNSAEELSRKLTMEVSVLKHEKEILSNAEKRACDEVRHLSERVHRLQVSLDTIQSAEEVREEARAAERKKQEEHIKQVEKEWAEAKKQLQEERDMVRSLTSDREQTLKNAMKQVEEMGKELSKVMHACAAAEARAAVAEARLSDLEKKIKSSDVKVMETDIESGPSNEVIVELREAKEEIVKLKEEAQSNKDHMLQYKSIAQVNEDALKQMELAHENFKTEAEKLKRSLEDELASLRERVLELENESCLKSEQVASAAAGKEESLSSAVAEIRSLKEESEVKTSQILAMEIQISALKEELEREHGKWRTAQSNYERQVVLQSETIQELTKTSQALGVLQEEASELRKLADAHTSENVELKAKWEMDKSILEESRKESEKKYNELNEQNKILHSRVEALHIKLAEKDRISAGNSSKDLDGDSDLQTVVNYLRGSKQIAETEISLLKQEKMRLQSRLESALKAAETAQALVTAERANSRSLLMTEEEIKSLQLQLREMNLLRESNMQLREENKHNFDECQKLREVAQKIKIESEALENQLREREIELEARKKEIELQQTEKANLERRVAELLDSCKNIDVEDYDRLKNNVQLMEEKLKEKDGQIEEIRNLLSKKQETISQLEQELTKCRLELSEREKRLNDISQSEANTKSEVEKHRKAVLQHKRKMEILSREKEQISKENEGLSKQLEEMKQGKRFGSDAGDQAMKEKEEKEARIQILEKTVERQREELKKERDENQSEKSKRAKNEKIIMDALVKVEKEKTAILSDLGKHNEALKRLCAEREKLKHAEGNLPEGSSAIQLLSGANLDDNAAPYISAAEDFEKAGRSILNELGVSATTGGEASSVVDTSAAASTGPAVLDRTAIIASSSVSVTTNQPAKATEERERRVILAKPSVAEPRKTARRLVRPRLFKNDEPHGDVEMPEGSSQDAESQGTLTQTSHVRKRLASSTELNEDSPVQGQSISDASAPALKKSKGPDAPSEACEEQEAAPLENLGCPPVTEEQEEQEAGDSAQTLTEEAVATERDETEASEKVEDPKEPQVDATTEMEFQDKKNIEEIQEKPGVTEMAVDDEAKNQAEQENQQSMLETESEKEEGELMSEVPADPEGDADASNMMEERPDVGEGQTDLVSTPLVSPGRVDDESLVNVAVGGDEVVNDDKNEEGELVEEEIAVEGSDKSNEGGDPTAPETNQLPEAVSSAGETTCSSTNIVEPDTSKQPSSSETPDTKDAKEAKQASPASQSSTLVNLQERARERALLRVAGVLPSGSVRGRGRPAMRARGVRGGRTARGRAQNPGQQ